MLGYPAERKVLRSSRRISPKKCLAALLLVAALAVSCCIILNGSGESEAANPPDVVHVANKRGSFDSIAAGETKDYGGGETASYINGVLTLTNFSGTSYSGTYGDDNTKKSACIYADGSITLVFEGNQSTVTFTAGSSEYPSNYGIYVNGDLTIKNRISVDATVHFEHGTTGSLREATGIHCTGKLTVINESKNHFFLYASGGTQSFNDGSGKNSFLTYGISCASAEIGSTENDNRLTVSAIGGDITTAPSGGTVHSIGIYSKTGGIDIRGNTELTGKEGYHKKGAVGGSINISGYNNNIAVISAGIYTANTFTYDLTNAGRYITAIGGDIYMESSSSTFGKGGISYGIHAGTITAIGGKITATGGKVSLGLNADTSNSYGIWAPQFSGSHTTITATAGDATKVSCGFCSTGFDIGEGSTITCRGGAAPSHNAGTYSVGLECIDYTGRNGSKVTGTGGTVCYSGSTAAGVKVSTITLNGNAQLTGVGGDTCCTFEPTQYAHDGNTIKAGTAASTYGVYVTGNSVQINGTSVLKGTGGNINSGQADPDAVTAGVYFELSQQDLTVSGKGSIKAYGGTVAYSTDSNLWNVSAGVYTKRALTINGVNVDAKGGTVCTENIPDTACKGSRSFGIYAKTLSILGGAVVSAEGGANGCYSTSSTAPKYNDSIGIYVTNGNLSVSGVSSLTATGKGSQRIIGIFVNGNISVSGSSTITVSTPAHISNGYIKDPESIGKASIGIYLSSNTSSFSVPSGTITVTGVTQAIKCNGSNTNTFSGIETLQTSVSPGGESAQTIPSSTKIADVDTVYVKMGNAFSVMISGWTYGDDPSEPVFSNPGRVVSCTYTGTDVFGDQYESNDPPTNAGSYIITVIYDGDKEENVRFTVAPRTGGTITHPAGRYVYNGTEQVPLPVNVKWNGKVIDSREYHCTAGDVTFIYPGNYSVTITLDKNYAGSFVYEYIVSKIRIPEPHMFNITIEYWNLGYTGEPIVIPTPTFKVPTMEGYGSLTVTYEDSIDAPVNPGQYTVYLIVEGGEYVDGRKFSIGTLKINPYTVSFDCIGGTGYMYDVRDQAGPYILPDSEFTAPAGKVFSKWAEGSPGGTQYAAGSEYNVLSDVTFYAVWEDIVYNISFDGNGGTGDMTADGRTLGQTYELPDCGFTAPVHKEFKCWLIGGTEYDPGDEITIESDVAVKAVWKHAVYTVTASIEGGHGTVSLPTQTVNSGEDALEIKFTAGDHHVFASYTVSSGNTLIPGRPFEWSYTFTNVTGNVDLVVHTIEYFDITLTGMTGCTLTTDEEHGYAFYGDSYTFKFALKDGYAKGEGFAVKINGVRVELTNDSYTMESICDTMDVTVTGVVLISYTINYDLGGGTASNPDTYTIESSVIVLINPTKEGHIFTGWTGTGLISPTDSVIIAHGSTGNRTYTATWEPFKYTVTWKSQDGEQTLETDLNVPYGTKPTYDKADPTKARTDRYTYTFAGWAVYADQESGTAAGDLPVVTGDVTYYAAFSETENKYTATFNLNGGSVESIPSGWTGSEGVYTKDFVYGTSADDIIADFGAYTRAGHTEGALTVSADTMGTDGMTINANWTEWSLTVTFLGNGNTGGEMSTQTIWYSDDGKILTPNAFVKTRHHFTGWNTEANGGGARCEDGHDVTDMVYAVGLTITFHAQWEINPQHTVTFNSKGGSPVDSQSVYEGETAARPSDPEYVGYVFIGWYKEESCTNVWDFSTDVVTSAVILYAKWEDHHHQLVHHEAVPATCTEAGKKEYWECTECGKYFLDSGCTQETTAEGLVVAALDHDHTHVVTEPTCTEGGYTTHTCSRCGHSYVDAHTEPLGHDWTSATYTWSADGRTCTVTLICGRDSTHTLTVPDVSVSSAVKTAATASSMGMTSYTVSGTYQGYFYSDTKDVTDIPALQPDTSLREGTSTYESTVSEDMPTAVTDTFNTARTNGGDVEISVSTGAAGTMTIAFDSDAVNAIAGNHVILSATVRKSSPEAPGAFMVIEVNLNGAAFSGGKAKVSVPLSQAVPEGKTVKVYFINGDERQDMNAVLDGDNIVFETGHFSTYAVFFEDAADSGPGNNGGGFPIWVVFVIIAVVAVAGAGAFFFVKNKKA